MKILVGGIQRIFGKSKKTGNAYDFSRLFVLQGVKPRSGEGYTVEGSGFEVQEMACESEAVKQFAGVKFPSELDVITEARPGQGGKGFEVWVVGLAKAG